MSIVFIKRGSCRRCYSCVRNCPAKAIRVRDGQAEIIEERCISCGTCVPLCARKAISIQDDTSFVERLLTNGHPVAAAVSSTFPAAFENMRPLQFPSALRALGFQYVIETSFGAQLASRAYTLHVRQNTRSGPMIASACPVITNLAEKYFPSLVASLIPIVSPTVAMARLIKQQYGNHVKVVFVGPCVAKKSEILDSECRAVDACLTYREVSEMLAKRGIELPGLVDTQFDEPFASLGRSYPIIGGYWKNAAVAAGLPESETLVTGGRKNTLEVLRSLANGELSIPFIDLLYCEECVNGPMMNTEIGMFERIKRIREFASHVSNPQYAQRDMLLHRNLDLSRTFRSAPVILSMPTEPEIRQVLGDLGMPSADEERNCGACGYDTCREKAIAVAQGIAEMEMCLPFLMEQLHSSYKTLIHLEKMSSLGQMAASVVHQINNPIHGVLTYIRLLLKNLGDKKFDPAYYEKRLQMIEGELMKCCSITKAILETSRQEEPNFCQTDINKLVEHVIEFFEHLAKTMDIRLIKQLDQFLPTTRADPDYLQQVFNNIALNALQAMTAGGCLTVSTFMHASGRRIGIAFEDTGSGISPQNMEKLFTPFFTTKGKGEGVGLGLAVCQNIIRRHGGQIDVESELGKGTKFTIWLMCQSTA
jgi:signal transduction histidine kinase/Fe-S-cluster-containing hydrogenase component 2